MKLVDANVLLYAVDESSRHHDVAREWLDLALSGGEPIALPWLCLVAFMRISTDGRIFPQPLRTDQACAIVAAWTARPNVVAAQPTSRHPQVMAELLQPLGAGGNLVNDAHLAALAVCHQATVVTFDNDFSRFLGVRWQTPESEARLNG